ncbi:MAG: hypothetical protein U1F83_17605 [Verrucomicrobiota bacterium]
METLIFYISVDLQHGAVDLGYVQRAILDYDANVLTVHSGLMDVRFPEREEGAVCVCVSWSSGGGWRVGPESYNRATTPPKMISSPNNSVKAYSWQ